MKKQNIFQAKRERCSSTFDDVWISFVNGLEITSVCYRAFLKKYGIKLKPGEKKKIAITIEEVK